MDLIVKNYSNLGIFNGFFELERNSRKLPSRSDIGAEIALGNNLAVAVENRYRKGAVHVRVVMDIATRRCIRIVSRPSRQGVYLAVGIGFKRRETAVNSVICVYL